MILTQTYKNAFTEVSTILNHIEAEEYMKVPEDIISIIEKNKNIDYKYKMNEYMDIFNQPMLPETKAILFNFFRDYWATTEQKEKIKIMQKVKRQKIEENKKIEYSNYNIFKDSISNIKENSGYSEKTSLIEIKNASLFIRIFNKIKSIFKY